MEKPISKSNIVFLSLLSYYTYILKDKRKRNKSEKNKKKFYIDKFFLLCKIKPINLNKKKKKFFFLGLQSIEMFSITTKKGKESDQEVN